MSADVPQLPPDIVPVPPSPVPPSPAIPPGITDPPLPGQNEPVREPTVDSTLAGRAEGLEAGRKFCGMNCSRTPALP
jgi:hypothetical protein